MKAWVKATDLQVGQWLHTSAGTWVQISAIERWTQVARLYNLTVAGIHTYYVIAGNTPVLVHNASCRTNPKILGANMEASGVTRPGDTAPHHIVASTLPKAAPARAQLARFGIDISDADNGVFLPRNSSSPNPGGASVHSHVHTTDRGYL